MHCVLFFGFSVVANIIASPFYGILAEKIAEQERNEVSPPTTWRDIAMLRALSRYLRQAGIRYSDNPASLPTGTLQSFGANVVPNPTFQRQGDFAFVGAASLSHRYDFGRQDSGTLETDFSFYTAKQFQVTNADVMLLDLGVGPRMELIDGPLSGVQLKPFVSGRYITVNHISDIFNWT